MGLHPAGLFRQLTDRLTVVLHGGVDVGRPGSTRCERAASTSSTRRVERVVTGDDGASPRSSWPTASRIDADAVSIVAPVPGARRAVRVPRS